MGERAHDPKCTVNGMPCHKYIVRNIKTEYEMLEFERAYADLMTAHGYTNGEVETALLSLSSQIPKNSPIHGQTFDLRGEGPDMGDFVTTLLFDTGIERYSKCTLFYKKFDKKAHACELCEFSTRFSSADADKEGSIIRFLLESEINYQFLYKNNFIHELFRSCVDVLQHTAATRAYPLHLYKVIAAIMADDSIREDHYGKPCFGEKLSNALRTRVKKMKLPDVYQEKKFIDKLLSFWEFEIYNIPLCSKEDALSHIQYLQTHNGKYDNAITEYARPSVENIESFEQETAQSITDAPKPDTQSIASEDKTSRNCEPIPEETTPLPESDSGRVQSDIKPEQEILEDSGYTIIKEADFVEISEIITVDEAETEPYVINEVSNVPDNAPYMLEMGNNLIYMPYVRMDELASSGICLDRNNTLLLSKFESSVMKDKVVGIECVICQGSHYILFWEPLLRTFFYTNLRHSMTAAVVRSILSGSQIRKVCYSPYMLYGLCKKHDFQIRNMESLQTRHAILGNKERDYISVLNTYHINIAQAGIDYKCTGIIQSEVFMYLPLYLSIYRRQERSVRKHDLQGRCDAMAKLNEAIGYSFFSPYINQVDTSSCFITMPFPMQFRFAKVSDDVNIDGYLVMYKIVSEHRSDILRDLLCKLSEMGRFRKCELQLVALSSESLYLFIGKSDFNYLFTLINTLLVCLRQDSESEFFTVNTGYKYMRKTPALKQSEKSTENPVPPKEKVGSMKKKADPSGVCPNEDKSAQKSTKSIDKGGGSQHFEASENVSKVSDSTVPGILSESSSFKDVQRTDGKDSSVSTSNPKKTHDVFNEDAVQRNIPGLSLLIVRIDSNKLSGIPAPSVVYDASGSEYTGSADQLPF